MKLLGGILLVAIVCAACSGSPGAPTCVAGMVVSCPCLGGADGVQTCGADGTFGACMCPGDVDASIPGPPDAAVGGSDASPPAIDASVVLTPPTVLASGLFDPFELALNSTSVFWTNTGGFALPNRGDVSMIGKDGTGQLAIVEGLNRPTQLGADEMHVYWTNETDGTIQSSNLTGTIVSSPVVESPAGHHFYGDIALDSDSLFLLQDDDVYGYLVRFSTMPFDAMAGAQLLRSPLHGHASAAATDGVSVFFLSSSNGTMTKSPVTPDMASTTSDFASITDGLSTPVAIAVDSAPGVFVAESGSGLIDVINKKGGDPTAIAIGLDPVSLALDATDVYWCEEATGRIMKVSRAGGATTVLAVGQDNPRSIAVDATSVYWINRGTFATNYMDGSLSKLAK